MEGCREHTLMFIFTGAPRLALELLAQLVEQLRQAGVGGGHHPAMGVVHGWGDGSEDGNTLNKTKW